jgi:hypothetical protein
MGIMRYAILCGMDKDNTLITILALIFIILVAVSATKLFPSKVLEIVNTDVHSPVTVQSTTTATTSLGVHSCVLWKEVSVDAVQYDNHRCLAGLYH